MGRSWRPPLSDRCFGVVSINLDAARRLCLLLFFVAQWPLLADGAQWFDEITDRRRLFMDGAIFWWWSAVLLQVDDRKIKIDRRRRRIEIHRWLDWWIKKIKIKIVVASRHLISVCCTGWLLLFGVGHCWIVSMDRMWLLVASLLKDCLIDDVMLASCFQSL